jgi:nitrous oxidase accessory protein
MRTVLLTISILFTSVLEARTIITGKGQAVASLKQALTLANDGDTILLKSGTYREGNNIIRKAIVLFGENGTVLDGELKHEILTISGHDIVVRGIRFVDAGYSAMNDFAAVKLIDCVKVTIEQNTVINAYFAIHVSNSVNCTIRNNIIAGTPKSEQLSGNGIHLWKCSNALIDNNHITGHRDGIYFEFVTASVVSRNISERNIRYGLHFMFSHSDHYISNTFHDNGAGVAVMYSHQVTMEKNRFDENWGPSAYGLLLKEISDSRIEQNTFQRNTSGIYMEGTSRIQVLHNNFVSNGYAVRVQASCDGNDFKSNNFFGNSFDVATNGTMVLNTFSGNYWDKYEGYDINKDGTGDIPYHPISMYSMIVEQTPSTLILMRSFMVTLMDKAEKAIPSLTPENLVDDKPNMKPNKL